MTSKQNDWALIEARVAGLGLHGGLAYMRVRFPGDNAISEMIPLPILPSGRIHEVIRLPRGAADERLCWPGGRELEPVVLEIRRLGWFESTWRMANRVIDAFIRLPAALRVLEGLSVWLALCDLPEAYRIATRFRFCSSYPAWIANCDHLDDDLVLQAQNDIALFPAMPHFHVIVPVDQGGGEYLTVTLPSLHRQLYRNFTCTVVMLPGSDRHRFDPDQDLPLLGVGSRIVAGSHVDGWLSELDASLSAHASGEWVMLLPPGAVLADLALFRFAREILDSPDRVVFYADDDALDATGQRCAPRFKPDWSLPHFRETNFLGDMVALLGERVAAAGGLRRSCCQHGNYDLVLRVLDVVGDGGENSVAHIPAVLLHQGQGSPKPLIRTSEAKGGAAEGGLSAWGDPAWCMHALRAHLARNGVAGEVSATLPTCWRVRYPLPEVLPLVSIIVPTRDAPALIRQCVDSLLEKTTYPHYEILIVDNQSADPQALAYLNRIAQDGRVRVLHYDRPFNYSAINNFAVREAKGELLCLLNNDTEVISPDWLEEMVGQLAQPMVAAVGAKLYFPDGRIQHAGVVVGPGGCANHLHAFIAGDDPGYCNRAAVAQDLQAVTAACMLTWRKLYLQIGGLDAKYLKVAFNDVDYCLRLRAAGYRVVWTPHAELYHHESVSRGKDTSWRKSLRAEREVAVMRRRWKHLMLNDPFYNPNLNYMRPDFTVTHLGRTASSTRKP